MKCVTKIFDLQRATIVSGEYEPNEEECTWTLDDDEKDEEELSEEMKQKATIEKTEEKDDTKGVPEFWLTIFKNVELLADMIQDHDEPILKHLVDLKVVYTDEPMGFELQFYFSPNDYFENTLLTKKYEMKCVPEEEDPFSFEGPEIHKCQVWLVITWQAVRFSTVSECV